MLARSGVTIGRGTQADWVGVAAFHLRPVVDRLADHLKASTKLFMDETTAPVLDPGRGRTKTGYPLGAGPRRPQVGWRRPAGGDLLLRARSRWQEC